MFQHYMTEKNGNLEMVINPDLAAKQKITHSQLQKIKALHLLRLKLFDCMRKEPILDRLWLCIDFLEQIEFAIQKEWNFEQDRNMHSWWFQSPHCSCPEHANWQAWERMLGERIINPNCIIHGEKNPRNKIIR